MTLQEESILSCYQELCTIQSEENIFLVRHTISGKLYIKKVLRFYDKALYLRLMNEHVAGIPQIYECIEDGDRLILIEEYIHGDTLDDRMKNQKTPFSEEEVILYSLEICQILRILHQMDPPVIHRDIKPANVMITADGHVRLIDFNVARSVNPANYRDTVFMGTQDYAAPEQYGFGQSDVRTDIYSLGATMNQLLIHKTPSEDIAAGRLESIIRRCTRMDPRDRYPSVDRLQHDLQQLADEYHLPIERFINTSWLPRRWLLPGFRKRAPLHIVIAIIGYGAMISIALAPNSITASPADTIILNIFTFLLMFISVLWFCDYGGFHRRLPGMQGPRVLRIACLIIYWLILMSAVILLCGFFTNLF